MIQTIIKKKATCQFLVGASIKQNYKRVLCFYAFYCLVITAIYGCAYRQNAIAEKDEYVAIVRSAILEKGGLSDQEKAFIMKSDPETGQYKIAGTFGQYFWHWSLPTGRSIDASLTGDLETLDTRNITIQVSEAKK